MKAYLSMALVFALSLSACSNKQPTANERYTEIALQDARDLMKDPSSVKFKDVSIYPSAKCMQGKILGKNGFGAYAGYSDFVWIDGKLYLDDEDFHLYMKNKLDCSEKAFKLKADQRVTIPQA
ncbi:hypothetical protein QUC32_11670 [Novosphingobium resinovorum]|uniref:hypothetical protein n=1 Tax=Novosphingobium TaxID=165696 RepID=UPI001B3C7AE0|nr:MULTISPECIES: hypothetical protein [Novosphingobium]MBF7010329.1 hypothetical protein [Novosphingobium sp. HR1a]WJM28335.1 hypothetical protein QUC32_11670 [Novosphingobium resinovorum]